MKSTLLLMSVFACAFSTLDVYAWGNKESKQAKAVAKAERKAEKQKNGIKEWQLTRFCHSEVQAAIQANGRLAADDIKVTCNLEEAQSLVDALLAGYVTIVNILDGYVEVEEGNAVAGLVAKKVEGGANLADAVAELSASDRNAYEKYMEWLSAGENEGKMAIEDDDLEKIMDVSSSFKEKFAEIKESIKGKKGGKIAAAKDAVTVAKLAGSTAKGGMMLKGILDREKKAKKLMVQ